jgi:hypothetical protein
MAKSDSGSLIVILLLAAGAFFLLPKLLSSMGGTDFWGAWAQGVNSVPGVNTPATWTGTGKVAGPGLGNNGDYFGSAEGGS